MKIRNTMKIKNAILICLVGLFTSTLHANTNSHIQPVSHTSKIDSLNEGALSLDIVRVSDIGNCSNLLEWVTPSEKNCYSFVIMKSTDKINFTSIGSVLGNGTSNQTHQYEFIDEHASTNNYYRIDQFDFKGNMISSKVLMTKTSCGMNKEATIIEEVYENPLTKELSIRVHQNTSTPEKVQLTDQFGKVIIEKNINLTQGKNILRLNLNRIIPGTYFIKVGVASQKFKR